MLQPPINCGVFFTLLVGAHLGAVRDSACRSNHAVTKKNMRAGVHIVKAVRMIARILVIMMIVIVVVIID